MEKAPVTPVISLAMASQRTVRYRGRWIYCGQDYLDMLRWEKRLGASSRVSYSHLISDAFISLRRDFVEWTARLGRPHGNSLDWWITPLAARNTMQTPIFLHICYLHILLGSLREELDRGCLIVCEDWFLLRTFEFNLEANGFRVKRLGWWPLALGWGFFVRAAKVCGHWAVALTRLLNSLIAARLTSRSALRSDAVPSAGQVLIHTCVDESCLGGDGRFRDRFFSTLPDWLAGRGYRVVTIPWLYNVHRSVSSAYKWFRNNEKKFLIIDDYARLSDCPGCFARVLRSALIRHNDSHFGKWRVSPLLARERVRNLSSANLIKFLLYEQALARWFAEGNDCDQFIDMFENMAAERPQLKAIAQSRPQVISVGYQHAPVPSELIGYSVTAEEWATGIFPSRIVTHGRRSAEFLRREGFPAASVVEGPALRYAYLFERNAPGAGSPTVPDSEQQVLVMLPLELPAAAELLARVLGASEALALQSASVALKVHPMMPLSRLITAARITRLPAGWTWSYEGMRDALEHAALVVGLGTGALLEAAAFGVPVICVGRELGFAYNPLDVFADRYEICRTVAPDALAGRLVDVLRETHPASRFGLWELSREILEGFGTLDDAHYAAFT